MNKEEFLALCARRVVRYCNNWLVSGSTKIADISTVMYAICNNQHFGIFVNEQTNDMYLISYVNGCNNINICHNYQEYSVAL